MTDDEIDNLTMLASAHPTGKGVALTVIGPSELEQDTGTFVLRADLIDHGRIGHNRVWQIVPDEKAPWLAVFVKSDVDALRNAVEAASHYIAGGPSPYTAKAFFIKKGAKFRVFGYKRRTSTELYFDGRQLREPTERELIEGYEGESALVSMRQKLIEAGFFDED